MTKVFRFLSVIFVAVLLLSAPQANAVDWVSPFKQLVSPTESAEREAARAEHKAKRLEKEADKVNEAAEEARLKAEKAADKAQKKAAKDDVLVKRSVSKKEPVKKEAVAKAPEPKDADTDNVSWQDAVNPLSWFGGDKKKEETAEWSPTDRPKVYREEALTMQAVHTPVKSEALKTAPGKVEKLSKKEQKELLAAKKSKPAESHDGVVIETERGEITIELFPDEAPKTVANFVKLVDEGFYNKQGMKFHRVVPGFVVQTGDPTGTGTGGSRQTIPLEVKNKLSHEGPGWVGMARGPDPNSGTSQFYITLAPQKPLDGKYAIFGRVISGFDALNKIEKDDKVYGAHFVDPKTVVYEDAPETDSRTWKKWF